MKRVITVLLLLSLAAIGMFAQKTVYIPNEWKNPWPSDSLLYKESDPDNKYTWSKSRSVESDNIIVFWDKGYGTKKPSESPSAYKVDEQDLLQKCEAFYDLEINKLGFADPMTSNLSKYKIMVLLNHTTDWVCYGGGYDYQISALWIGPSACKPVGHSVAHEVGHSFQYMCFSEHGGHKDSQTDNTGFHLPCGNGQTIWEQTAQWQAAQSYPSEMFNQSISVFRKSHNLAFSHEWHRYQSYWLHYYLSEYYDDITTVAQVWNQPMTGQTSGNGTDFNQALMRLKNLNAKILFRLYYDYAARCATWDFDACRSYGKSFVGDLDYRCVALGDTVWQVALASAPQASGFNIIPLAVPEEGTMVTTRFTALPAASGLAEGDPAEMMNGDAQWVKTTRTTYIRPSNYAKRGFRLGYVALLDDGTRQYIQQDSLYCKGTAETTCEVSMTVPADTKQLWLVVLPAPTTYVAHKWDDNANNDDQWPYRFSLQGTTLGSRAQVYVTPEIDGREVADITLTYDVWLPKRSSYDPVAVNVSGQAQAKLCTAFQMQSTDISDKMQTWSSSGPSVGKVMFYPMNPKTQDRVNRGSTANGYGHWFNASGSVTEYANGYLYSEFAPASLTFSIGQYPDKLSIGKDYTIGQILRYKQADGKEALARFIFCVHITNTDSGFSLVSIDYDAPTAINEEIVNSSWSNDNCYDLSGRRISPSHLFTFSTLRKGIYIMNGRKFVKK
ncbi:MAG: DUF4859 domain-containing protein [Bacteroidaceae bacterium]|nr:DUF4859 domain-containing protein [Bacteroidaceae bacterium]